jgi:hypothetical protein
VCVLDWLPLTTRCRDIREEEDEAFKQAKATTTYATSATLHLHFPPNLL